MYVCILYTIGDFSFLFHNVTDQAGNSNNEVNQASQCRSIIRGSLSFFLSFFFLNCFGNCMNLLTVSNFKDRKLVCDPMLCERKEYHVAVLLGCMILYKSLKTALEFDDKFISVR